MKKKIARIIETLILVVVVCIFGIVGCNSNGQIKSEDTIGIFTRKYFRRRIL